MRLRRSAVGLAAVLLAAACSRKPATIDLSPKTVKIYGIGRAQRLSARVLDKKGEPLQAGAPSWSSSDAGVAEVGPGRPRRGQEGREGDGDRHVRGRERAGAGRDRRRELDRVRLAGTFPRRAGRNVPSADVDDSRLDAEGVDHAGPRVVLGERESRQRLRQGRDHVRRARHDERSSRASGTSRASARSRSACAPSAGWSSGRRRRSSTWARPSTSSSRPSGPTAWPSRRRPAVFRSSDAAVASVDSAGVATGRKTGAATIRVELAGASAEATLIVN